MPEVFGNSEAFADEDGDAGQKTHCVVQWGVSRVALSSWSHVSVLSKVSMMVSYSMHFLTHLANVIIVHMPH